MPTGPQLARSAHSAPTAHPLGHVPPPASGRSSHAPTLEPLIAM
ncbi:hypothetical protein [Streptomyces lincolnensis]